MRDKYKIIGAILVVIIVFILTRACSNYFSNKIREDVKNDTQIKTSNNLLENSINEYVQKYNKDWKMLVNYFLRGLIDYNEMPLSKDFAKKYPTLDNIIQGKVRGAIIDEYFDSYNENMKNVLTVLAKTGKGYEQIAYQLHYIINDKNELDDIEILDSRVYEDENGSYPQYDKYELYNDCIYACGLLVRPQRNKPSYLYVNENFMKKFPEYPNKGVLRDEKYMIEEKLWQDIENKNICYVEVMDLENTKTFKLDVYLDDKGYVDNVEVTLIEIKKTEDPEYVQSIYDEFYT